jgi:hypothetical protein
VIRARGVAFDAWHSLLTQFSVVWIGYGSLDMTKFMNSYDAAEAPFNAEKKRKEFPDAFAIEMLDARRRRKSTSPLFQAVSISSRHASDTAALSISAPFLSDDAWVEKMRLAIEKKTQLIEDAICDALQAISFHQRNDSVEAHGYDSVDSEGVDVSIVTVGDGECTITVDTIQGVWDSICVGRRTQTTVLGIPEKRH